MNRYLPKSWPAALVVLAGIGVYLNSLAGPFVFDDTSSIVTNPTIQHLSALGTVLAGPTAHVSAQARPVLNLSLAVNYAFGGTAVAGYHLVNLLVHVGAALALLGVVRRTLRLPGIEARLAAAATPIAAAISLLWVVHPLQTQAVTYVIQRAESLMGLFYLLTLYGFVRAAESARPWRWLAVSVGACLLGMATKEVMVTAPVVILLFDRAFLAGSFGSALRARARYYLALAATWALLAVLVASAGGNRGGSIGFGIGVGWWEYAQTQFAALAHYLRLSILPHPLVFEYGSFWMRGPSQWVPQALLVAALLAATLYAFVRSPRLGFLGVWFFAILSVTSLVPGSTQMIVEHRMYLPLAAVLTAAVVAAWRLAGRRCLILVLLAGTGFFGLTVARNRVYGSAVSLWSDTVAKRPDNALAHEMLAEALDEKGVRERGVAEHLRALEIYPDFLPANESLADDLMQLGRPAEALLRYQAAARTKTDFADPHVGIGVILLKSGQPVAAIAEFDEAIRLRPDLALAYFTRGNAEVALGRAAAAAGDFEAAVRYQADYAEARFNLANTLVGLGRSAEAQRCFEALLAAHPGYAKARYNYGNLLIGANRLGEAETQFRAALQTDSGFLDARFNLAGVLRAQGRPSEALAEYRRILDQRPDAADARALVQELESHATEQAKQGPRAR